MRDILFRGKICETCKYQGKWLIGYYAVNNGKPIIAIPKKNGLNGFCCDPETVGQYNGSDDKYIGVIYYNQSKANYVIQRRKYMVNFVTSWIGDVEVIGNIYDNPEMMND